MHLCENKSKEMEKSEYREILKEELVLAVLTCKDIFNVRDAGLYMQKTEDHVRSLCNENKIKANKPNGKAWYMRRRDVEDYLMGFNSNTVEEEANLQAQQYLFKK